MIRREMIRGGTMDVKQYGPALFPTLKQVRRLLDEAEVGEKRRGEMSEDVIPPDGRAGNGSV
jgi:hypothetical protein